jgi:hypothetical protein
VSLGREGNCDDLVVAHRLPACSNPISTSSRTVGDATTLRVRDDALPLVIREFDAELVGLRLFVPVRHR